MHVEDFAQLSGERRETKYESSMEKAADLLEKFCTFPTLEKLKLFQRTLFSFLVGNEDMHLKNFSLIVRDDKVELSPAYDLLNSTIVIANPKEELALPVRGRKRNLTKSDLLHYFAIDRLGLSQRVIDEVVAGFEREMAHWDVIVKKSFLPKALKTKYSDVISERASRIGIDIGRR